MKPLALAALAFLAAQPANALSCLRPDVARTYQQAAEADETYIVARGTLTFDAAQLPEQELSSQAFPEQRTTTLPARMEGTALMRDGFTLPFARDITLRATCAGAWCASAEPGTEVLGFLERGEDGRYTLEIGPCGGMAFMKPSEEDAARVTACFQGKECAPAE